MSEQQPDQPHTRIVVASEGRPIDPAVVTRAVELAGGEPAEVLVVTVARVWGTSLGFPNPWLLPSKREWDAQREIARKAVKALEKSGLQASAHVFGSRRPGRRIVAEATRFGATAIVMGADPKRPVLGDLSWSQEPHRVARRSKRIPVHLVQVAPAADAPAAGRRRRR